jgi:hypothetical protein
MRKGKDPEPDSELSQTSDFWIRMAQKHADPADPDPQHCNLLQLVTFDRTNPQHLV